MRALFYLRIFFSFLESIFQRRRITGKERKENTRRVKNSRRKKRKYLKKGKSVWFAEKRITDKEKKEKEKKKKKKPTRPPLPHHQHHKKVSNWPRKAVGDMIPVLLATTMAIPALSLISQYAWSIDYLALITWKVKTSKHSISEKT